MMGNPLAGEQERGIGKGQKPAASVSPQFPALQLDSTRLDSSYALIQGCESGCVRGPQKWRVQE